MDDPTERPTAAEYDRYLWLLESLKRARYDEEAIYEAHPFLVKDVLFSVILVAANEALRAISQVLGASAEERATIDSWISRGRLGLEGARSSTSGSLWTTTCGQRRSCGYVP